MMSQLKIFESAKMHPHELRVTIASGLLSFPVTHFDDDLEFNKPAYQEHISWLSQYDAAALFAAGGTGELFSLTPEEIITVVKAAKDSAGDTPIIAGCGYGTKMAIEIAQKSEQAGADGILLLPNYLIAGAQEGMYQHIKAVCDSVDFGVIIYNRANTIVSADTVLRLAENCPNLIGFKDGTGDINLVREIIVKCGKRLSYVGGMPTHEMFAEAYDAMGVSTYSSAVFNFVPEMALEFYTAMRARDKATMDGLLKDFFYPFMELRDKTPGYAVSAIKAGVNIIGKNAGKLRPPLTDLTAQEVETLAAIMKGYH